MLCLKNSTNDEWIRTAISNIDAVIMDHAHCEKKAAGTGMSLLSSYPEYTEISLTMSDLIEEEIGHYRSVIQILNSKGITLGKDKGDPYVKELMTHLRTSEPGRMLDRLIVSGLIEARSCERLQLLGENIPDDELKEFYKDLAASEAGHYVTFIKLAKLYFDDKEVQVRLDELSTIEAKIVKRLPNHPSIHG
ncbi:MAG: tRNA-(ms[2]io[6]A)-hydroxylase [Ignavibacteriales bacterium]|nr:MAG: tRNA-(ms[2]io[6]A)-hydroxylase [Ignavibacteriales bacterium]